MKVATQESSKPSVWREPVDAEKLSLMDHLFNRFDGMYPQRWRSAFPTDTAIRNWKAAWREAFEQDAITVEDVARGIKVCRSTHDWPPSLAEFLKCCRVKVDYETAFYEAVEQMRNRSLGRADKWTHAAIYWAAIDFTSFELNNTAWDRAKARWTRLLSDRLLSDCPPIPLAMIALPKPGGTMPTRDRTAEMIAATKSMLSKYRNISPAA